MIDSTSFSYEAATRKGVAETKSIVLKVVVCIATFSLGVSFVFLPDNTRQQALIRFQIGLAFAPMQGFFNMAIFICEMVDSHRQFYVEGSICDTANKMSTPDMQEPCFISIIAVLEKHEQQSLAMGPSALQGRSALAGLNC